MTDNQKAHIEQLSEKLKCLGDKIQTLKTENSIPFSFYRDSFNKTQEITRLLHEMELFQIDEMKSEMEKLITHLSESRNSAEMPVNTETEATVVIDNETQTGDDDEEEDKNDEDPDEIMETRIEEEKETVAEQPVEHAIYVDNVSLPNFNRPSSNGNLMQPKNETVVDIKQYITLNDRYLFQRELFHNNRKKMENFILILNTFDSFDEAEKYIGDNTSWNFDDETVKSFVAIVQKGFE